MSRGTFGSGNIWEKWNESCENFGAELGVINDIPSERQRRKLSERRENGFFPHHFFESQVSGSRVITGSSRSQNANLTAAVLTADDFSLFFLLRPDTGVVPARALPANHRRPGRDAGCVSRDFLAGRGDEKNERALALVGCRPLFEMRKENDKTGDM